ncbi:hypothetical protein [Nocardioides sp. Kera G14]|uniref:hypothetical protein n=1 Tax=Nocardioides sp. Kera G14 TaxID=2884264 RepID=UPI00223934C7|nr:hypothetical protein [Nocardioides sp. Kera G14]
MSITTSRLGRRSAGAVVASALSLTALAVLSPSAHGDTVTAAGGATATVADAVAVGKAIHITGTGWTGGTNPANGSTIGVKLGDALDTEPAAGPVTNPATGSSADNFDIWAAVEANADGTFSADIAFPTTSNTAPALASEWAVGSTHTLRLLSGSLESGDTPRSVLLTFTVSDGLVVAPTTAASGAVTVAFSGGSFPAGEVLSVKQGDTARQWTPAGRGATPVDTITAGSDGSIGASVVLPAGAAPAGANSLTITGDKGTSKSVSFVAGPAITFANGTGLNATGTLTLGNLKAGAKISSVKLGSTTTLAGNLTADASGVATASYTIPGSLTPVSYPLVITQTSPENQTYSSTVAVTPDENPLNTDKFTVTSSTSEAGVFYQGFYQSAYSAKEDALYVTASDRGTGNGGFLYKLDPSTFAIEASYEFKDHDGFTKTGGFGIGVDDVHGNVWVSNTGSASVAVYKESDLSLVKQFPANTITHPRDVVFDKASNQVFVSSASEGSSATSSGYISVFDATTLEKTEDVQTGTRDKFNPVALTLGGGKVYSPSLGSDKVLVLDTATLTPKFLTVKGLELPGGGRGASGITYADGKLFIASQGGNEVVVANAAGATSTDAGTDAADSTVKEVATGKQALNAAYDAVNKLVYVTNFGGTTVTVLDLNGAIVAKLPIATANHVTVDGKGNAFVVDKAAPVNRVWKISLKPTPPSTGNQQPTPPVVHLTPAQQKVAKAQAKVASVKAKIAAVKESNLKKKAKAKKLKALKKQLANAKKKLKKAKLALKKANKKAKKKK